MELYFSMILGGASRPQSNVQYLHTITCGTAKRMAYMDINFLFKTLTSPI